MSKTNLGLRAVTARALSLSLLACLATAPAAADPPSLRLSPSGASYELNASAPAAGGTWLAGSLTRGGEKDAFLTLLDPEGATVWEKAFGAEGEGDGVWAVAPLLTGGAVFSAGLNASLPGAWSSGAPADYGQQTVLATVDARGQLGHILELRATAPASFEAVAYEPNLRIHALAVTPSGELLAGGRWTGDFQGRLSSGGPLSSQALLLRLSPELKLLRAVPLPGDSLDLITVLPDRILAAGVVDSRQLDPMGPADRRAVVWELGDAPVELWRGELRSNTRCLQLDGASLLASDNDSEQPYRVELATATVSRLPEGALAQASLGESLVATGYQSGQAGSELSEVGGALLWEKGQPWRPILRWGTTGRDFVPFAFSSRGRLTLLGTSDGDFPGSPSTPGEQRWVWVRMDAPPTPEQARLLGARGPGQTRSELAGLLHDLTLVERPGYDHFAGFYPLLEGPPAALITGERKGFDGWSLLRRDPDSAASPRELACWGPEAPPQAPLEPQIHPRLSGDVVICRDVRWLGPDSGLGTPRWTRLAPDGRVVAQRSLSGERARECQAVVAAGGGRCVWFGLEWSSQGQSRLLLCGLDAAGATLWSQPFGPWHDLVEQDWLGATGLPDGRLAALARIEGRLLLQTFFPNGEPSWKLDFGERFGHTLGMVGQQLLVITSPEEASASLEVEAVGLDGVPLWTADLLLPGPARAARLVAAGDLATVVGGVRRGQRWCGFVGSFRALGEDWALSLLEAGPESGLQDAVWLDGGLWVGGELTRDYVTDVFWGRLKTLPLKP